jgi:hypothetical protein
LVGKPEKKKQRTGHGVGVENSIKMHIKDVWEGMI